MSTSKLVVNLLFYVVLNFVAVWAPVYLADFMMFDKCCVILVSINFYSYFHCVNMLSCVVL